jgi:hypothetical protein
MNITVNTTNWHKFYLWGAIFRTLPDRPWGPPSLLYNRYRIIAGGGGGGGVKRPGRGINHPSPSSAQVKKRV